MVSSSSNDLGVSVTGSTIYIGSSDLYGTATGSSLYWSSPSGTKAKVEFRSTDKGCSPRLFFKLVKSKLEKVEVEKLRVSLKKLVVAVESSKELSQQALYESLSEMVAIAVRELEVAAAGYGRKVTRKTIDKLDLVYKPKGKKVVYFKKWEEFPRCPPDDVKNHIKKCRDLKLFDELWVLYTDYSNQEIKTNERKILDKDPILFGSFSYQPDVFYFIADWVDEFCDLTLEKFIEVTKEPVNEAPLDFEAIKLEVLERHRRLKETKPSNYQALAAEEVASRKKEDPKVPWYKRIFKGKKSP